MKFCVINYWATLQDSPGVGNKVFLMTISAVSFFLYNFYVGDLTATMTVGNGVARLRSFQEALDQKYTVYTAAGTAFEDFFRLSPEGSAAGQIYRSSLESLSPLMAVSEFPAVARMRPKVVFFGSAFTFIHDEGLLPLAGFRDALRTQLGLALQRNSELRRALDHHVIRMKETGVFEQLERKWLEERRPPDWSHRIFQEDVGALGYENLFFPALVMIAGVACGLAVVFLEFAHRRLEKRAKRRKRRRLTTGKQHAGFSDRVYS